MNNQLKHHKIKLQPKKEYGIDNLTQRYLKRLLKAIINREKIVLFGYHDIDGVLSISTLLLVLRYLNADVEYFMPREVDCTRELKSEHVEEYIRALGTELIITIGCGIHSDCEEKMLKDSGIDILVLDNTNSSHIVVEEEFYKSDENVEELYIYIVLFKLINEINDYFSTKVFNKYTDLIMLGIISKYEKLSIHNERLLANGLRLIGKSNNYGILSLFEVQNIEDLTLQNITYTFNKLKPSINPLGKMDNSKIMVELFTTDDRERAIQIAKYISKECKSFY